MVNLFKRTSLPYIGTASVQGQYMMDSVVSLKATISVVRLTDCGSEINLSVQCFLIYDPQSVSHTTEIVQCAVALTLFSKDLQ